MKKTNKIEVIGVTDFVQGLVAEVSQEDLHTIELNEYYINQFGERQKTEAGSVSLIDVYQNAKNVDSAIKRLGSLARKMVSGTRKVYISSDIVDTFEYVLG